MIVRTTDQIVVAIIKYHLNEKSDKRTSSSLLTMVPGICYALPHSAYYFEFQLLYHFWAENLLIVDCNAWRENLYLIRLVTMPLSTSNTLLGQYTTQYNYFHPCLPLFNSILTIFPSVSELLMPKCPPITKTGQLTANATSVSGTKLALLRGVIFPGKRFCSISYVRVCVP
jgi:hypothetical protein